ncbi:HET-domain-containing protein [Xylariaceae sp. FL0255]|nr:HET-domain-containing protein [Xylariaceae sp. FL0255]
MAVFQYRPLDVADRQIRLLDVFPGSGVVVCKLRHVSLTKLREKYETISYCWGSPTTPRSASILVDDSPFAITPNLHAALLRLRPGKTEKKPRTLWIDAICINQDDKLNDEKNTQIKLMGDIYSSCERVNIWLGENDSLTEYTFKAIAFMATRSEEGEKFNYYDWKQVKREKAGLSPHNPVRKQLESMRTGTAFASLFSRPWFQRVWVIQEVALPPSAVVLCGKYQIDWELIEKAQAISKTNFEVNNHLGIILKFRNWPDGLPDDMFSRMVVASHQGATNARDKIYGLMGMAIQQGEKIAIDIDYNRPVNDIFADFTRSYLERTGNLHIFVICRGSKVKDSEYDNYPSWAIEPAFERDQEPLPEDLISWGFEGWDAYPDGFSTGGHIPCRPTIEGNSLGVQGYSFDIVKAVTPANNPGSAPYGAAAMSSRIPFLRSASSFFSIYLKGGIASWKSALSFCQLYLVATRMIKEADLGETYQPTGQAVLDAFWQVIRGRHLPVDHPKASPSARKQFSDFDTLLSQQTGEATSAKSVVSITRAILGNPAFMELFPVINLTKHRRFFMTEKGYMGLGPRETKPGDHVLILQGHCTPILARGTEKNNWKVVGDTYVHGIMEGEAFEESKCELLWFD